MTMRTVQMTRKTFTQFLNDEMRRRDMSARKFAEFIGVNHAFINKYANAEPSEVDGYPSIHTLRKISDATGTSLLALIALVFPDAERITGDIDARLLAEQIAQLSPEDRAVAEGFIRDALAKRSQQEG